MGVRNERSEALPGPSYGLEGFNMVSLEQSETWSDATIARRSQHRSESLRPETCSGINSAAQDNVNLSSVLSVFHIPGSLTPAVTPV
jgi:hypothetical protein